MRLACRSMGSSPALQYEDELKATAKYIAQRGRGILASDESNATTNKRLDSVNVEGTEENRRLWRQCLYTAPGLGNYISGAIMFEETLYQSSTDGEQFVDVLKKQGEAFSACMPSVHRTLSFSLLLLLLLLSVALAHFCGEQNPTFMWYLSIHPK